jgi:hypothetical protein
MNEPIGFNLSTGLVGVLFTVAWEFVIKPWLQKRQPGPTPGPGPVPTPAPSPNVLDLLDLLKEILNRVRELGPEGQIKK